MLSNLPDKKAKIMEIHDSLIGQESSFLVIEIFQTMNIFALECD